MEMESTRDIMERVPILCAHLVAESLGYCTPTKAASIIRDAKYRQENWCEWIHACYSCDPLPAVRDAIRRRHYHKGYMAEYRLARALIDRAIETGKEPELASWF